jgi:hypothetical protein
LHNFILLHNLMLTMITTNKPSTSRVELETCSYEKLGEATKTKVYTMIREK